MTSDRQTVNVDAGGVGAGDCSVAEPSAYLVKQLQDKVYALVREAKLNDFRIRVEPFVGGHTYSVGGPCEMFGKDAISNS